MKTAVLIHGCYLQAKDWENIIWGDPSNNILGRVPKGLQVAFQEDAELIYWGTGASEKDGVKESQHTFNYARNIEYGTWCNIDGFEFNDRRHMSLILESKSFVDTKSQNTPQEVARCMEMCKGRGIERLILVSSPTHIARCLQSAEKIRAEGGFDSLQIFATASDTCFAGSTPDDVLIVEPPHRGDRPEVPINHVLRRAMRLGRGSHAHDFYEALKKLLSEWE